MHTQDSGTDGAGSFVESLDDLLAIDDIPKDTVSVKAWGGRKAHLWGMTNEERVAVEEECVDVTEEPDATGELVEKRKLNLPKLRLCTVAVCLRNSAGARMVVGPEARAKLNQKSAAAIMELWPVAARLSGILESKEAKDDAKKPSGPDRTTGG